jgi:hypothetical protein
MSINETDVLDDIKLTTKEDIKKMIDGIDKDFSSFGEKIKSYLTRSENCVDSDKIKEYREIIESYLVNNDDISNNIIDGVVIGMFILSDGEGSNKQKCNNVVKVLESIGLSNEEIYEASNIIATYHKSGHKLKDYWNGYLNGISKFIIGTCDSVKAFLKERSKKVKGYQFKKVNNI